MQEGGVGMIIRLKGISYFYFDTVDLSQLNYRNRQWFGLNILYFPEKVDIGLNEQSAIHAVYVQMN
jgi:hypothetical protein